MADSLIPGDAYVCVNYPAHVESDRLALCSVGGERQVSHAFFGSGAQANVKKSQTVVGPAPPPPGPAQTAHPPICLESTIAVSFDPNIGSIHGPITASSNFLVRVRRRKAADGKSFGPSTSECIGRIIARSDFRRLADFSLQGDRSDPAEAIDPTAFSDMGESVAIFGPACLRVSIRGDAEPGWDDANRIAAFARGAATTLGLPSDTQRVIATARRNADPAQVEIKISAHAGEITADTDTRTPIALARALQVALASADPHPWAAAFDCKSCILLRGKRKRSGALDEARVSDDVGVTDLNPSLTEFIDSSLKPLDGFSRHNYSRGYKYKTSLPRDRARLAMSEKRRRVSAGDGDEGEERGHRGSKISRYYKLPFDAEAVPTSPSLGSYHASVSTQSSELVKEMRRMFDVRPVWSRNALCEAMKGKIFATYASIGKHLKCVGYQFSKGPWRALWVRYGFDPRTLENRERSWKYQLLTYKVDKGLKDHVRRSRRADVTMTDPFFTRMPKKYHNFYQLEDLMKKHTEVEDILGRQENCLKGRCDQIHGWVDQGVYDAIKAFMDKKMRQWVDQTPAVAYEGAGAALDAKGRPNGSSSEDESELESDEMDDSERRIQRLNELRGRMQQSGLASSVIGLPSRHGAVLDGEMGVVGEEGDDDDDDDDEDDAAAGSDDEDEEEEEEEESSEDDQQNDDEDDEESVAKER